jgi:hypothetical protein
MTQRARGAAVRTPAVTALVSVAAMLLTGCVSDSASTPTPTSSLSAPSSSSTPAPPVIAAASPRLAALAARTAAAAARGRRLTYLEYLCSISSRRDPSTTFVAVHERTSWQSGRVTLDAVLAQAVTSVSAGSYRPGRVIPIRTVRNGRLGGDAITGLVGPGHRCSAEYLGAAARG